MPKNFILMVSINRTSRFRLLTLLSVGIAASCAAQSATPTRSEPVTGQMPKLCMPVSYRQTPSTAPINTKILMLGERYQEVAAALSGWKETGVPLIGRFGDRWEPVPCGDDTGLFYLVPLFARVTGWTVNRSLDVFLSGVVLVSALIGFAGLWLATPMLWQRILATVPIFVGAYLSYKMGDVYVVQGSVVLMLLPWIVYLLKPRLHSWQRLLISFLSGTMLGFSQWIRTQSGSSVLVFFAVLLFLSALPKSKKITLFITLLAGMSLPLIYAHLLTKGRDRFLAANQPGYQPSVNHHVIWHTAYLGLGYLTNSDVPEWRDSVAVKYVETVDPSAIYGGEEYEAILRSRVVQIAHQHPRFIVTTIAAKAGVLAFLLLLCINIGLPAAFSNPKPLGIELAFWLAITVAALPGVVAIPEPQYVLAMITLALFYWYYSSSFFLEARSQVHAATGAFTHAHQTNAPLVAPLVRSVDQRQMEALLSTYPRSRPSLPFAQQTSYVEHYRWNRAGARGLARIVAVLESWMHRRVSVGITGGDLLEIGAGNLNHVSYLPTACVYEAVEPFQELLADSPYRARAGCIYYDIGDIQQTRRYDCVFSVAVLEHLLDLPFILARAGLLLRAEGSFRAGFPSEGGLLWGLAWRLTTGIQYRLKRGLDYGAVMRHEHVNTANEILLLLDYFYEQVEISRFPLPFGHFSFYTTAIARRPRLDRCQSFDALRSASSVAQP
jgi:hypothetical protein